MHPIEEEIRAVIAANPDKVNPQSYEGQCFYDDGNGNHCLIGQWLVDTGQSCPDPLRMSAAHGITETEHLPLKVRYWLSAVQSQADGVADHGGPIPWGTINLPPFPEGVQS